MAVDYSKFRTPFYEVRVSDSSGKRSVSLPHHILRLVEKIEITETFEKEEFSTITMSIVEGSREPASQDPSLGTNGMYKLNTSEGRTDTNISGSITNRTGSITDLRFSGDSGITFLTESELKNGKVSEVVQENVIGKDTTRSHPGEASAPRFLFQERNQLIIRWGYLEDSKNTRTIRGYIANVKVDYTENSGVTTTITAFTAKAFLDQVTPRKGVPFGRASKTQGNNFVVTLQDQNSKDLLEEICSKIGIKCIVSSDLPNPTQDKFHTKVWVAGQSFTQFLNNLASEHDSYWDIVPDPKNGDDILIFIKHNDLYSQPIKDGDQIFDYKNPQSLLLNVSLTAKFDIIGGAGQLGLDQNGEPIRNSTEFGEKFQLFSKKTDSNKKEEAVDYRPTKVNPIQSAKGLNDNLLGGSSTGTVELNPSQGDTGQFSEAADVFAKSALGGALTLEFTSLGYPKITPGKAKFTGLGVRFSGNYDIKTVTHTIEPGSYLVKGTALSPAVAVGGVPIPEAKVAEDTEVKTQVQLFQALTSWRKTNETN